MSYRSELIQVAAVALAAVQNLDSGSTELKGSTLGGFPDLSYYLVEVGNERHRQEKKWGAQNRVPVMWMTILMEEVGEAARAILEKDLT